MSLDLAHFVGNRKKLVGLFGLSWLLVQGAVMVCHLNKPLPSGISFLGQNRSVQEIRFLKDLTYLDDQGVRQSEQEIFDAVFEMIDRAETFVLVDMFLFNPFLGDESRPYRRLSDELTERLLSKRASDPSLEMVLITDPINTLYGGTRSEHLSRLEAAGIRVVMTSIERLRDSNPAYSSLWRMTGAWLGNSPGSVVSNPFGAGKVSLRSFVHLLNFKANHRKVIIADDDEGPIALVTTANPHDGSSAHENVALQFRGEAVGDVLKAERAVLALSGAALIEYSMPEPEPALFIGGEELTIRVASEGKIKESVIDALEIAGTGDVIRLVMLYLSDRDIINTLIRARQRGAEVRVLLDPNRDAFGREKSGVPNRQAAFELSRENLDLKWRETHGEQCHSKLLLIEYRNESAFLSTGSANYTRRNLDDFNLELNVVVQGSAENALFEEVAAYFEALWNNESDRLYSVAYEKYEDSSLFRRGLYRVMEQTGFSTF